MAPGARALRTARSHRLFCKPAGFNGIDLQGNVAAIDAALRKGSAGKPEARLSCPAPHVAKLLRRVVKTPDRSDTAGDGFAEQRGQRAMSNRRQAAVHWR